jgi:hypothetical protein
MRLSPSQHTVTASAVTTADAYVAAGAPAGLASVVSAAPPARAAAADADTGSSPARTAATSTRTAARTAVRDASSARGAEETPSHTTTTAAGPPGHSVAARAIASSLRVCRSPRSVTPAASPTSSST